MIRDNGAINISLLAERKRDASAQLICSMKQLTRITFDPNVMGGKPCIRGLRVTIGTIVGLIASGNSHVEILKLYPYLEKDDIREALVYAAWRVMEIEPELAAG